jgi:hypothetical protein
VGSGVVGVELSRSAVELLVAAGSVGGVGVLVVGVSVGARMDRSVGLELWRKNGYISRCLKKMLDTAKNTYRFRG